MSEPNIVVVGSLNMDIVIEADRSPQVGETIMGSRASFIPGGKGANQAVAAARLGAHTVMIGAVGNDGFGHELLEAMENEGIAKDGIKVIEQTATGIASIFLIEQDNSIVVVSGANSLCTPEDLDRQRESIAQADIVLLQMEIPLETVTHAARIAKQYGKTVVLNPAPAPKEGLPEELLQNVDYITPNRSELSLLTGMDAETESDSLEEAMLSLQAKGVSHIVTTLGSEGSAFLEAGGPVRRVSGFRVPVTDTTGAGDSFNAGLAYAIASGRSLAEAVDFASRVSALAVTKFGAQAGMPTREEVEHFSSKIGSLEVR